jgi:hypothetical protein
MHISRVCMHISRVCMHIGADASMAHAGATGEYCTRVSKHAFLRSSMRACRIGCKQVASVEGYCIDVLSSMRAYRVTCMHVGSPSRVPPWGVYGTHLGRMHGCMHACMWINMHALGENMHVCCDHIRSEVALFRHC